LELVAGKFITESCHMVKGSMLITANSSMSRQPKLACKS